MLELNFSDACAIPADDGGSVILTGGVKTPRLVTRYSVGGWVEDRAEFIFKKSSNLYWHQDLGMSYP